MWLFFFLYMVFFFLFLIFFSLSFFFKFSWDFFFFFFWFLKDNVVFLLILFFVVLVVLFFSFFYMSLDLNYFYFMMLLLVFVLSMCLLICSNSLLLLIVSWDLLGISSFFLVLYYNNWDSCSGAMNTVLTNRLGDFFLFLGFSLCLYNFGLLNLSFLWFYFFFFLLFASFTKSAQFPFSGWLPKAMSAPTPVSSLVHSSTLVTAGLVLMFCFNYVIFSNLLNNILFLFGLLTILFSNVLAIFEKDLKKIIALSTLSQMGFCMFTLGLNFLFLSFFHLISHALFKSCLFMQLGFFIYYYYGQQDMRGFLFIHKTYSFIQFQFMCCLFNLCGIFFLGGLLSKDYVFELFFFYDMSFFFFLCLLLVVWLTFQYSFILYRGFFFFSSFFIFLSSSYLMFMSTLLLYIFSLVFMWLLVYNVYFVPVWFLYLDVFFWFLYLLLFFLFIVVFFFFFFKIIFYKFLGDYFFMSASFNFFNIFFLEMGFGFFYFFLFNNFLIIRTILLKLMNNTFFFFIFLLVIFLV